tara:strand:- start:1465 stop:1665 length:201 start_codon:yes stop_codon:yes gene_type:complete
MKNLLAEIRKKIIFSKEPETYFIEDDEVEVTDEIEKALLEIKDTLDLETEEVERAVLSRKQARGKT